MQGGLPEVGVPNRSWVQTYWRYVAASTEAKQRRRWAFFSGLLRFDRHAAHSGDGLALGPLKPERR
jgi:hypothetical protein